MDSDDLPIGTEDELVTTSVDYLICWTPRWRPLAQHASQVQTDGGFFARPTTRTKAMGVEHSRIAAGEPPGRRREHGANAICSTVSPDRSSPERVDPSVIKYPHSGNRAHAA